MIAEHTETRIKEFRFMGDTEVITDRSDPAVKPVLPDYDEWDRKLSEIRAFGEVLEAEKRLEELRYNHNHDSKGRFCSGSGSGGIGGTGVDKSENSGIMKENVVIGRSLGASAKNYPVKLPNGNHSKFAEGTEITDVKTFAGKGTNTPIKEAFSLESNYGIKAEKWEKVRGTAYVIESKRKRKAEVHWYEADGKRVKMKVKRYYDES